MGEVIQEKELPETVEELRNEWSSSQQSVSKCLLEGQLVYKYMYLIKTIK